METAQEMELLGVLRLEVDGNHRHVRIADELDHRIGPGDVFDHVALHRGPSGRALVGGHLARGEKAEAAAGRQMLLRQANARQAAARGHAVREGVHRDERILEGRDHRQDEVGHNLVIGTHRADHGAQDHPVGRADGVVRDGDEGSVLRDVVVLNRVEVVADAYVLEDVGREFRTLVLLAAVVGLVDLVESEQPHRQRGEQPADGTVHMQHAHYVGFIDYLCFFLLHSKRLEKQS